MKKIYETSDLSAFHPSPDSVPPIGKIQRTHPFQKQIKSKKGNPEREERLTEEIRNEAPIDGIPEVRRRRDSSENRVQERIVAAEESPRTKRAEIKKSAKRELSQRLAKKQISSHPSPIF